MAFFSRFGLRTFSFDGKSYEIDDLTKRVTNNPALSFNNAYYKDFRIPPSSRPDQLAWKLYEDPNLWWTFFIANNLIASDWPLEEIELEEYMNSMFTTNELLAKVVYRDNNNNVPANVWNTTQVGSQELSHGSNIVRENSIAYSKHSNPGQEVFRSTKGESLRNKLLRENDEKHQIRIISVELIGSFVEDFFLKLESIGI